MNLQKKTLLVLLVVFVSLIVIVAGFVSSILLSSYTSLENEYAAKDLSHAVSHIQDEETTLAAIAADWGPWDDTYNFINGSRPDYLASNLGPDTFSNLHINLFAIADANGKIVYAGAYDLRNRTMVPVPAFFRRQIDPADPLMNMTDPRGVTSGFILLPDYPMLVASRPIVRSDFSGTPRGVVILGRSLDPDEVEMLASLTQPSLSLTRVDDPSLPPELLGTLEANAGPVPGIIEPVSNDAIRGSALLRDIYGRNGLVLTITEPRHIYGAGITTILQFIGIILATGLVCGLGALIFLDRNVLSRIGSLSSQVYTIGRDTDFSRRVEVRGDDELAGLEREINRMLGKIEETHHELQESETRFRELTDLLPQIIFEMDTAGNLVYINRFGLSAFGLPEDGYRLAPLNAEQFLVPDDIGKMRSNLQKIAAGQGPSGDVYTLIRKDGSRIRALVYTAPIIHDGELEGFRGSVIDITERLRLQEALADNEDYLKTLLATIQVGIVVIDADTFRIVDANPAALAMIGTSRELLLENVCHRFICPSVDGNCPVIDRNERIENAEQELLTCDGRKIPIIKYVVPVLLHGRQCLLETFIDNSYRKQIELQLKESEEKYRALTESTPDILFSTDIKGDVTYVSPQINQYGFLAEEIVGRSIFDLVHPEDRPPVAENFGRELHERAQFAASFRIFDKWGHIHWFEEKSFLQLDEFGKQRGVYGMLRDITERRRAEDAIELANKKLNLMNNITRHDILNTITGLLGCVDMAGATTSAEERAELFEEIKDLARVIERQINFTKQYQEVGVHLPAWQNLNEVIRRVLVNFGSSGIRFSVELESVEIYADPLLEKVFYNLVDNAIRYGKTLTTIQFYFLISDKGLSLICEDNGVGIAKEYKHYIFERGVGQNTGMGLFLSREILGITRIEIVENGVPGKGARFEMLIPRGTFRFGS